MDLPRRSQTSSNWGFGPPSQGGKPTLSPYPGMLRSLDLPRLTARELEAVADQLLTPGQRKEFETASEIDFAFGIAGLARFRSNFYRQRRNAGYGVRRVSGVQDLSFEGLNLPPVLKDLASARGLVSSPARSGSGKSTTLAAMIHWVKLDHGKNIVTLETRSSTSSPTASPTSASGGGARYQELLGRPPAHPPAGPRRHHDRRDP